MNILEQTNKILGNEIDYEVTDFIGDVAIQIEIYWGDWKHSHLRADYLMEQNGFKLIGKEVTEEDGSDCYSARHTYCRKERLMIESND